MTYGTSHLLIGGGGGGVCVCGGGIFRGRVNNKYCCVKGGYYMKNKNIGGMCLSTQPDQQKKVAMQKCAKNAKHYQTLKKFSTLVSLTWHFTKFIFLEQLTPKLQFNMQNTFFFFFFFFFLLFSKQSS